MKSFCFYLTHCRPKDFLNGGDIGDAIRHTWGFQTTKFHWKPHKFRSPSVKVTFTLNKNKTAKTVKTKLHGYVFLDHVGKRYSHNAVIAAIRECNCSCYLNEREPANFLWFIRVKVEAVTS